MSGKERRETGSLLKALRKSMNSLRPGFFVGLAPTGVIGDHVLQVGNNNNSFGSYAAFSTLTDWVKRYVIIAFKLTPSSSALSANAL